MGDSEIVSVLEGCRKAHNSVKILVGKRDFQVLEILEVLQDTAISVGEAIEKDYGLRQAAVLRLEEYCVLKSIAKFCIRYTRRRLPVFMILSIWKIWSLKQTERLIKLLC